jgi:hypothetical protein
MQKKGTACAVPLIGPDAIDKNAQNFSVALAQ